MVVSTDRVIDKFLILKAARRVCTRNDFNNRTAALRDFTPEVLAAFGEGFLFNPSSHQNRIAILGGMGRRLKQLWGFFKKAPEAWQRIKLFLGIESLTDIPKRIKEWAKSGLGHLKKALGKVLRGNPLTALYFIPPGKVPTLTDAIKRLSGTSEKIKGALNKVNTSIVQPIDKVLAKSKFLRIAAAPVLAAIFIFIWMNVSEISWDIPSIIKGFTGQISLGDLFESIPESSVGLIIGTLFPGLGTFALLPIAIIARFIWLLGKKILTWVGKGFMLHWKKVGVDRPDEFLPVY